MRPTERTWLVLVHQIPPEPPGLRVRVWRRLQAIGALQLKSSVYLLPDTEEAREDFEWLLREIVSAGAEATLLRSTLEAGTSDAECIARFRAAATAEYRALLDEVRDSDGSTKGLEKLAARLATIERRDHFGADGRESVAALLVERIERAKGEGMNEVETVATAERESLVGMTWTTRAGVYVDRMASAWLIRRFIDAEARFRFVTAKRIDGASGELRFDTFGGEFTHEGDRCTFEVLCDRLRLDSPGLRRLGDIVHDLDLKDDRYGHPETFGIAAALDGIVASTADDLERIERASVLFDSLLARFASTT